MKRILFVLLLCPAMVLALTSFSDACCYDYDGDGYKAGEQCPLPPEDQDCYDDPSGDLEICQTCTCEDSDCTTCAMCIHPGVDESCSGTVNNCFDGVDNDCDGLADQDDPGCDACCEDLDGDGYESGEQCLIPPEELDCYDDPSGDPGNCGTCICGDSGCTACAKCINPGADEACCDTIYDCFDGADNDCDGLVDQEDQGCREWCENMAPWDILPVEASTVGATGISASRHVNYLAILFVPLATILIRRWTHRR
jgi:hypothetical protein